MVPCLPIDVLEEICYRLPLKSIVRFMSICKQWNSLLSHPQFVDVYKTRRKGGNQQLIFVQYSCPYEIPTCSTMAYSTDLTNHEAEEPLPVTVSPLVNYPHEFNTGCYDFYFLGSYNGFVAVLCRGSMILWNPLTGKYYSSSVVDCARNYAYVRGQSLFGLCYDASSDTYMAIIIAIYVDMERVCMANYLINLKTCTRKILSNLPNWYLVKGEGKVVCGVPHWVVEFIDFENPLKQQAILYFDLKEERLKQMKWPCQGGGEKRILGLGSLNGQCQLGLVLQESSDVGSCFKVWVMKEYGNSESWTNLFLIPPYLNSTTSKSVGNLDLLGYTKNGELVIDVDHEELWGYDPGKGGCRRIQLSCRRELCMMIVNEPSLATPPQP